MKLDISHVIALIVASALGGMILGGAFGYVAGQVSPEFFSEVIFNDSDVDPINAAAVGGAAGGIFLGGGLGVFAILVQLFQKWLAWLNKPGQ